MKNTLFILLLASFLANAQNGFNYQAIIADSSGAIVVSQTINIRLSIVYSSANGTVAYTETHGPTTDARGLINIVVGAGTQTSSGAFTSVDWSTSSLYLKTELNLGSGYVNLGTDLIGQVPIALFAKTLDGISVTSGVISATGAIISGTVTATKFSGDGSGLTNISNSLLDSNNTVAIGGVVSATGSVAVGYRALYSNTSGLASVANGFRSLYNNTTGSFNIGVGPASLEDNTTGTRNIAIGSDASANNTIGAYNISMGVGALRDNVAGSGSIAIGYQSMMYANNASSVFTPANTAIGFEALMGSTTPANNTGTKNTAIGYSALKSNTSGYHNTATGYLSLQTNNIGYNNTAYGRETLRNNTGGDYNTAIGNAALYYNIGGNDNTAVGHEALIANTTGNNNIANGGLALQQNQGGGENVASGYMALRKNVSGNRNVAVGFQSLVENTASYNTAIGWKALDTNTTGTYNTAIGYLADVGANNLTNATAIGSEAIVFASNSIQLGDSNVTLVQTSGIVSTTGAIISGTVTATKFSGDGSGLTNISSSSPSDRRLKKNIINTKYGLNTILKIRPVDYQLKSNNLKQIGFIAQELKSLVPEAVSGIEGDIEKGETLAIMYTTIIPILTKAIQEQEAKIKKQDELIKKLILRIESLEK